MANKSLFRCPKVLFGPFRGHKSFSVFSRTGKKHLAQKFKFTYRYIDGVLSLNNSKNSEFIDLLYPCELEIKDTTESNTSASYLDCYLCTDNGELVTRL